MAVKRWGFVLVHMIALCSLIETQPSGSENIITIDLVHPSKLKNNTHREVDETTIEIDNVIKQITNVIPEIKSIKELVDVYVTKIKYSGNLSGEQFQLLTALKLIKKVFYKRKRKMQDAIANLTSKHRSMFHGCSKDPYPHSESKSIKTYEINLDNSPEDRWTEVVQDNKKQLKKLVDFFEETLGPVVMSVIDTSMTWLHHTLPSEFYRELDGISLASGISVARVTLYNVFYELFSLCTSVVVEGEDGKMYHGRNLDFGVMFMGWDPKNHTWLIAELLRPLIVKVDFTRNGKLLYSAVSFAGYTGILTGVKKNTFSLSINERFIWDGGFVGLAEWIVGLRDAAWLGQVTRRIMESADSYEEAQQLLAQTQLLAPAYFILAGNMTGQGCVVTRGRSNADIWPLGRRHQGQRGSWFLVETNYDHWREPPFYDRRRHYAELCADAIGRHDPKETLYRVLSTSPVLNKETTLTAVMDVREGLLDVWERDCPDPCWPFA